MHITAFYAALLAFLFIGLSVRTVQMRHRFKIAIGDAANPAMLRAMRAHANFTEYVPLGILLIFFVETTGASMYIDHVLGASIFAGRIMHAYGVSQTNENFRFRIVGMALTLTPIFAASVLLLFMFAVRAD